MNDPLDKIKEHIDDKVYDVESGFPLNDNLNLDEIIEREYQKAFEILDKYIEYIERKYGIDYKKPELVMLEDDQKFISQYSQFENKIIFSKKSIEKVIDNELEFLGYKEIERKNIGYLNIGYNTRLLYPFYIDEKDIRKAVAKFIILLSMYHEIWHSIDFSILPRVFLDHVIKDIDFDTFLKNFELRASAFQVVIYYLVSGLYKDERVYKTVHDNILTCRKYIKEINELQNDENKNEYVPYDLGFCYGNIIVAKYRSSLEDNVYKVIDNILHLDEKRAIDEIKHYI